MPLSFLNRFDGEDIFISYSREDGEAYLDGLATALINRGFSCFDDRQGTDAGPLPPETLFRRIRKCRTFVLLGTPGAIQKSTFLAQEVREFAYENGTIRILGVSFDRDKTVLDDWSNAEWYDLVNGKSRARELSGGVSTGQPSDRIVNRIEKKSDYIKSKDLLRRDQKRATTILICLLALIAAAAGVAWHQLARAQRAISTATNANQQADQARKEAESAKQDATTQKQLAETAKTEAETSRSEASTARVEASKAREEADKQQQLTRVAKEEAVKQKQNALESEQLSRRYDYVASLKRARSAFEQERVGQGYDLLNQYSHAVSPLNVRGLLSANTRKEAYDERDFSWYYLSTLYDDTLVPRIKHSTTVRCLAFSPDGKLLASGSEDGLQVTNLVSGATTDYKGFGVDHVAFSPNGTALAYSGSNGRINLYDVTTNRHIELKQLDPNNPFLAASPLAFSPDSRHLAMAVTATEIEIWDVVNRRKEPASFTRPWGETTCLMFSGDGGLLIAGDRGLLHVGDVVTRKMKLVGPAHGLKNEVIKSVSFAPNSHTVMTATEDGSVQFWDLERLRNGATNIEIVQTVKHQGWLAQFSPTKDNEFVVAKKTGAIEVWNTKAAIPINLWKGDGSPPTCLSYSPDSRIVAIGQTNGEIRLLKASKILQPFAKRNSDFQQVAFSPDGRWFVSGAGSEITVWDHNFQTVTTLNAGHEVFALTFSSDSTFLAAGGSGGAGLWDTKNWQPGPTIPWGPIYALSFSKDKSHLAVANSAGLGLWKIGTPVRWLNRDECFSVDFSNDGQKLAFSCRHTGLVLVSAHDTSRRQPLEASTTEDLGGPDRFSNFYARVKFSADSQMLVAAGGLKIKVWDLRTKSEPVIFQGHTRAITALALSNDSRLLVSSAEDRTLGLWDLITMQELALIDLHHGLDVAVTGARIDSLAFSKDNKTLAAGSNGIYVWTAGQRESGKGN